VLLARKRSVFESTRMNPTTNNFGQPIGFPLPGWKPPPRPLRDVLAGRYARLEPLEPIRHAEELFASHASDADESAWTYLSYGPFLTLETYRDWMEANCLGEDPLFFAIVDPSLDQPLGVASFLRIAPESGSIEVGHLNFSAGLRRGRIATEAMYLMMERAFELGYRRYEWKCDALNAPSRAAAQRLGLSFEGVFRQATVSKGRNRDTAWYAAIDTEWPALQAAFQTWLDPANFDRTGRQRARLSELTRSILKQFG
jgi:RimJ/RimL family protein N-acetyltransferase